jgi:hypothetical protein
MKYIPDKIFNKKRVGPQIHPNGGSSFAGGFLRNLGQACSQSAFAWNPKEVNNFTRLEITDELQRTLIDSSFVTYKFPSSNNHIFLLKKVSAQDSRRLISKKAENGKRQELKLADFCYNLK